MRDVGLETGLWYAFTDKVEQVTEIGYKTLSITEDLGVVATLPNHLQVSYGFDYGLELNLKSYMKTINIKSKNKQLTITDVK